MSTQPLSEIAQKILAYICKNNPAGSGETRYQSREDITGMLRLSLSEYDEAAGELAGLGLVVSDQPYSGDLDFIAPTQAGHLRVR